MIAGPGVFFRLLLCRTKGMKRRHWLGDNTWGLVAQFFLWYEQGIGNIKRSFQPSIPLGPTLYVSLNASH